MENKPNKKKYEIKPNELAKAVNVDRKTFDAETERLNKDNDPKPLVDWLVEAEQIKE